MGDSSPSSSAASSVAPTPDVFLFGSQALDESYRPLPSLYLAFLAIWAVSAVSWTVNTWKNRHLQMKNLQWMLASVPFIKALQLGLSFTFWYSCLNHQICSLWMSFGVYVTGILFQTASVVSFMLISHGYCITYERLSIHERRIIAALGWVLYLTLVGYKAAVPYFTAFLLLNYAASFFLIFRRISHNLLVLHEQLSYIQDEDIHTMHSALHTKYTMFKRFQGAMQFLALVEILVYVNADEVPDNYWFRLLVQEWTHLCIFLYIGWTFRTQETSPHFSVMPTLRSKWEMVVPPVYSIEMDAADFNDLISQEWHVGVPTSFPSSCCETSSNPLLVIVRNPHRKTRHATQGPAPPAFPAGATVMNEKCRSIEVKK